MLCSCLVVLVKILNSMMKGINCLQVDVSCLVSSEYCYRSHCEYHQESHQRQGALRPVAHWLHRLIYWSRSNFYRSIEFRLHIDPYPTRRYWSHQSKTSLPTDFGLKHWHNNNFVARCFGRLTGQITRHTTDCSLSLVLQYHGDFTLLSYSIYALSHSNGKVPR